MHRFFIDNSSIVDGAAALSAEESRHALKVLRLEDGDLVEALDGAGGARLGTLRVRGENAFIELGEALSSTEAPVSFTLYMGIPKGEKLELVAQKLTELGAARLVPVRMERCIAKIAPDEAEKKLQRPRRISREAQKQSGRQSEMEICEPVDFKLLPEMIKRHQKTFLLWENARGRRLWDERQAYEDLTDIACIVGAEGGITEAEAGALSEAGAVPVTLGPRILRAETAAIACAAEVMTLWGDI